MAKELIKIERRGDVECVSARELYAQLCGGDMSNYAKWTKVNIVNNEFAIENEDFIPLVESTNVENQEVTNPNPTTDYALTVNFAKHLCMLSRTKQGNKCRDYFIACEQKLKEVYKEIQEGIENGTYMKLTPRDKYRMMYAVTVDNMIGANQMLDLIRKTYSFYDLVDFDKLLKRNGFLTVHGKPTPRSKGFIGKCYNPLKERYEIRFTPKGAKRFLKEFLNIDLPINSFPESHLMESDLKCMQKLWDQTKTYNKMDNACLELKKRRIPYKYGIDEKLPIIIKENDEYYE